MIQTVSKYEIARHSFRKNFSEGIKPVDSRQPIPDKLALQMIQELDVSKDALIGVYDAFLILTTHLIEAGYRNIVVLENTYKNLSQSQEKYYNSVESVCVNSGIKYYIPPMNNWSRCNMKFDVIIGNPPYQSNDGNGDLSGSGTGAIWWKITQTSIKLLKDGGIISFITPTNILNGGDTYTKLILGSKRKLDLKNVVTNVNQFFPKVGTKICRWVAQNSVTDNNISIVNDDSTIYTDETLKIYSNTQVQEIIQTLINCKYNKFDISVKNTADPRAVSRTLQKEGYTKQEADNLARDFSKTRTGDYIYPINSNGKLKYGKVKWVTNGTWKMMIPHMGSPFKYEIMVSDEIVCDQSCDVQYFDNEQEALSAKQILDNPIYRWIIEQTRIGGRMSSAILSRFPNAPIEQVLSTEQLNYIKEQLK